MYNYLARNILILSYLCNHHHHRYDQRQPSSSSLLSGTTIIITITSPCHYRSMTLSCRYMHIIYVINDCIVSRLHYHPNQHNHQWQWHRTSPFSNSFFSQAVEIWHYHFQHSTFNISIMSINQKHQDNDYHHNYHNVSLALYCCINMHLFGKQDALLIWETRCTVTYLWGHTRCHRSLPTPIIHVTALKICINNNHIIGTNNINHIIGTINSIFTMISYIITPSFYSR